MLWTSGAPFGVTGPGSVLTWGPSLRPAPVRDHVQCTHWPTQLPSAWVDRRDTETAPGGQIPARRCSVLGGASLAARQFIGLADVEDVRVADRRHLAVVAQDRGHDVDTLLTLADCAASVEPGMESAGLSGSTRTRARGASGVGSRDGSHLRGKRGCHHHQAFAG